jgi:hypothetical protein
VAESRRLGSVAVLAAVAMTVSVLLIGAGVAPAGAQVRISVARVHWGEAREVPGTAALNAGGNAAVNAVSCWRPGDCTAGGFYTDASGHQQAFVVDEARGVWGRAQEVPGTAALNAGGGAQVNAVSCAPRGGCAAGGYYTDSKGNEQAFVVSQRNGRWGRAEEVPGTAKLNVGGLAWVHAISCASAGNCAAGGTYQTYNPPGTGDNSYQAFVVSERNGRWAKAETVPGIVALYPPPDENNRLIAVSCSSAGNCTAGGLWWGGCGGGNACARGFLLSLVNGRWHRLVQSGSGGPVSSVSCWHAGDCTAAGSSQSVASGSPIYGFAQTQIKGRWGRARTFSPQLNLGIGSLSCSSRGNCAAGGDEGSCECDAGYTNGAFVLSQRDGRWGKVDNLAGPASLGTVTSLSCASAGNCGAGGSGYASNDISGTELTKAFVLGERGGRWAVPESPPGLAALDVGANSQVNHVSCPSADSCAAGGYYTDAAGRVQAWLDG